MTDNYLKRGVSSGKEEVHAAIKNLSKGLYPNAFCKVMPDVAAADSNCCTIMHADTAGTKTSLAYIYWKETGDTSVWKGIAQDALVMNVDDMACTGVTDQFVISSTIGRNKHLIPGTVIGAVIDGTNDFIEEMAGYGIHIHHSGGETADVGDIVRTLDVGITAFARLKRDQVIRNEISPGQVVVGFASFGRASYEKQYNSGMGSNGLTSARHDLFSQKYVQLYPESFAPETDLSVVYQGTKSLTEPSPIEGMDMGRFVLSPTRTYLPLIREILEKHRPEIAGMVHCTGGGQTKVLHFIEDVHIIKDNLIDTPPLFRIIQKDSDTEWKEMYRVFNMGHRLEVYTDEATAASLLEIAGRYEIEAKVIGRVVAHKGRKVSIAGEHGNFSYEAN